MPMCQTMLQNQAKNITCQNVNFICPGCGAPPVQMRVEATSQKASSPVTPILRKPITPKTTNITTISGATRLAKAATTR